MKTIRAMMVWLALGAMVPSAHAGIPVIDAAHIGTAVTNNVQAMVKWVQQYAQMAQQYQQMVLQYKQLIEEYKSLNGKRLWSYLVNTPALRAYLPDDWNSMINSGYGAYASIRALNEIWDVNKTTLANASDTFKSFSKATKTGASNLAALEDAYKQTTTHFKNVQTLLDSIANAEQAKDIADLNARIQSETAMMQIEQTKVQTMIGLQEAERQLATQRGIEIAMKATRGVMPPGW